jgi:hypothetical protein
MTPKLKKPLSVILAILAILVVACFIYVRTHPLVFNESFLEHAHCMAGGAQSLLLYAHDHFGRFPYHTNGYGDALVMMDSGWDAALTGPGYDAAVFARVRRTGEDAPESEFGRVYVQGLSESNNPEIALLFDKMPTPGGDHCHFLSRVFAPLAREVLTIGGTRRVVRESEWPAFAKQQIELLVVAGIARGQAERYYSERPKQ